MKNKEKTKVDQSFWLKVLKTSLRIADWKVDRKEFLSAEFDKYCVESQLKDLLKRNAVAADLDSYFVDKVADLTTQNQLMKLTGISFMAGLPGGLAMAGTVPADIAQFYYHIIVLAQKLTYIYGWPMLFDLDDKETTDDDLTKLTLLIGVMFGNVHATEAMNEWADEMDMEVPETQATFSVSHKDGMYHLAAQTAKWLAIKITKESFGKSASKIVPIIGGIFSGGMSYVSAKGMTNNLVLFLKDQHFAKEKQDKKTDKKTDKKNSTTKKPKQDKKTKQDKKD